MIQVSSAVLGGGSDEHQAQKKPHISARLLVMVLWRLPTLPGLIQVSSAVLGLTSLFGMGRGEHQANSHQQGLCECIINVILEVEEIKSIKMLMCKLLGN